MVRGSWTPFSLTCGFCCPSASRPGRLELGRTATSGGSWQRAPHALALGGPTPFGRRGDRSTVGRQSDQEGLRPVPLAQHELADGQLAPLAKLGGAGIAQV